MERNRVWEWGQAVPEVMKEAIMKYLCSAASAAGCRVTAALAWLQDLLNHARRTHTHWALDTRTQICDQLLPCKKPHFFTVCNSWQMISVFLPPTVPCLSVLHKPNCFHLYLVFTYRLVVMGLCGFVKQPIVLHDSLVMHKKLWLSRDMLRETWKSRQKAHSGSAINRPGCPAVSAAAHRCDNLPVCSSAWTMHPQSAGKAMRGSSPCCPFPTSAPFFMMKSFCTDIETRGSNNSNIQKRGNDCDWSQYVKIKQKNINHRFVYYRRVCITLWSHTSLWCSRS